MIAPGFTGGTLDRGDRIRHDPDAVADAMASPAARLLVLDALLPEFEDGALRWSGMAALPEDADPIFLGLDGGQPRFAFVRRDEASPGPGRPPALLEGLAALPAGEAATYAAARSLVDWHQRHRFCPMCGAGTAMFRAGWARRCRDCLAEHFPRVDPVVIMLAEHRGRALVARGRGWPEGRYSALAGFVEPGESIEEAVARETLEEAGVRIGNVRYVASQPWPFPSLLMIACIATAEEDALSIDRSELEDAMWVSREDVGGALAGAEGAPFRAPPRFAIAHSLLEAWVEAG